MTADTPYYRAWAAGPTCQYPTCPTPDVPTPTTSVTVRPSVPVSSGLPVTGGDAVLLVTIAMLFIVLGVLMQRCRSLRVRS